MLGPRQIMSEVTSIDRPRHAWHQCIYRLVDIAKKLGSELLPAPYARYVKRISQELNRAAIELEGRNFPEARSLIDISLRSLDFLLLSQRFAEAKEELALIEQRGAIAADIGVINRRCVTLYGTACLLDDRGFSNGTRGRLLEILQAALLAANGHALGHVRANLTQAAQLLG